MKKIFSSVAFFISLPLFATDFSQIKSCLLSEFSQAKTPVVHNLQSGKDWYCSGVLLFKNNQGEKEERIDDKVLLYRFFKKDWGMSNYYYPASMYMPLVFASGKKLVGLFSSLTGVGDSFLNAVLRETPNGHIMAEWSVGAKSALNPNYTGAHIDNPDSVTSEEWNGYVDRRVVTRLYICTTDYQETLPCL